MASIAAACLAAAQTVPNGGFEEPDVSTGNSVPSPSGFFWTGTSWGIADGTTMWGTGGFNSAQYAYLQSTAAQQATLRQTFGGFTMGRHYRVRFDARAGTGGTGANPLEVEIGGLPVFGPVAPGSDWLAYRTRTFSAINTSLQVEFLGAVASGSEDLRALLDNVTVEQVTFYPGFVGQGTDGSIQFWRINPANGSVSNWVNIGPPGGDAKIVGVGDFDGDGHTDLLGQYPSGELAIWWMNNNAVVNWTLLGSAGDIRVVGVGDVNNDGFADILGQYNANNDLAIWFMQGPSVFAWKNLGNPGAKIIGVGDLDRNGYPDLLGEYLDGSLAFWYMEGPFVTGWKPIGHPGSTVNFLGMADYNNDGYADFLGRYPDTGYLAIWYTNGQRVINWRLLGSPGDQTINSAVMFSSP